MNLLFVFADELRGAALGCAGERRWLSPDSPDSLEPRRAQTPHLDRLAAEGMRFTDAVANSAVCTPARGSILTGCWPQTHRALANDLPVDPAAPSIARCLGVAGYRCGYIGKWHLGGVPRDRFVPPGPERLGFDAFWASWNCSHAYFHARYHLDTPEPVSLEGSYEPIGQTDLAIAFTRGHVGHVRQTTGEVGRRGAQPWCLFLSYGPPHEPYRPLPSGYETRYDPAGLTLRPNCPDTPTYRQDLADYYAHTTALDDQMGRLLASLAEDGQLEETLVVFTSDHGSMIGSHGKVNKHQPWEEATVIPLLMRGPQIPRGRVDDLLIGHVDLAPTLLSLLGIPGDPQMEGQDLAAAVRGRPGEPTARPGAAYLQAVVCADQAMKDGILEWRGVRTHRATYAEDLRGPWVLYDNAADPYQLHNLVADPAAAPLRETLRRELAAWLVRTHDVLEPKEAVLDRYGLTRLWEERAVHNRAARRAEGTTSSAYCAARKNPTSG